MTDANQLVENIKREIAKAQPSNKKIFALFKEVKANTNSDAEYYDVVAEIFHFNSRYYLNSLYPKLNSLQMAKYVFETFSLYQDERIVYEFPGKIKQTIHTRANPSIMVRVKSGYVYLTNLRIIAQGKLIVGGGADASVSKVGQAIAAQKAAKLQKKARKTFLNESLFQEIPCYGYQFKNRNHFHLKRKKKALEYFVLSDNPYEISSGTFYVIKITPSKSQVNELYEIMRKDINHTIEMFREVNDRERVASSDLKRLWKSEEYANFSDLELINIAMSVYELNPEHFMEKIYPKMHKWKYPSFLRVKDALIEKISGKKS